MEIEYRSAYFDDPAATASFERCTKQIFGLDFGRWKARGLWHDRYRPFSAFVRGECVASMCVYPLDMIVGWKRVKGAQLLTVGTLPDYRSQGIQRELWKRVRVWAEHECDFTFLFTDEAAAGFYERLGLRRQTEHSEMMRCPRPSAGSTRGFKKLDLDDDTQYAIVERLARSREMVSHRVGFVNANLLLFMFLYVYRDLTFYIEDIDAVVVVGESGDRLRVHDVVASKMPCLSDLAPFLSSFKCDQVEFLFCTDRLGIDRPTRRKVEDSVLLVSDGFSLDGEFIFPYSIRA